MSQVGPIRYRSTILLLSAERENTSLQTQIIELHGNEVLATDLHVAERSVAQNIHVLLNTTPHQNYTSAISRDKDLVILTKSNCDNDYNH